MSPTSAFSWARYVFPLASLAGVLACWCCTGDDTVTLDAPPALVVLGQGSATFDATTGEVTFANDSQALLDASNALPGGAAENCEAAGWNPGTLVLSVNARVANRSTSAKYLTPVELRLTGIQETTVVSSVNTDLPGAGCGRSGLTLAGDDLNHNGVFDCIAPDDTTNTADDPGWDYSAALGSTNSLSHGQTSACRFVHFNLLRATNFTFYFEVLGVLDDGWPPVPAVNAVTSPTRVATQTVSGRCVTTKLSPDELNPPPANMPTTNVMTILGGASSVTTPCSDAASCQTVNSIVYCGTYSVAVALKTNATNILEIYQTLDGVDRGQSGYATIVHDNTPPVVLSTNPASGSVGVSTFTNVLVTFSEAMSPTTINSTDSATANVYVRRQSTGARVAATVTLDSAGVLATLNPTAELTNNVIYEIVVATGVTDVVGNALSVQVVAPFTTAKRDDTVPPEVTSTQPVNGAVNLDRRASVSILFSEAILNRATNSPLSPTCVDGGGVVCTAIQIRKVGSATPVPATRTLSGDATTVTFTVNDPNYDSTGPDPGTGTGCLTGQPPTAARDFDCNTSYTLTVSTAITDLAGNALAVAYSMTFKTGISPDTVAPTVQSFSPPAGATGVVLTSTPEVLFSEAIMASTVNASSIALKENGVTAVQGTVSLSADGLLARFTPAAALKISTRYVLFVNSTITDLAGNALAAPQNSDFTTAATSDTTPPTVVSTTPPNHEANVGVNTSVTVLFSEPMDANTIDSATVVLNRMRGDEVTIESQVTGQVTLSADRRTATFLPSLELAGNRRHVLNVTTGVKDAAGNAMAAAFSSDFWTIRHDSIPPCVVAIGPADHSTTLAQNSQFALAFSETLFPGSVVGGAFNLWDAGNNALAKTVSLSADGTQVQVMPNANLPVGQVRLQARNTLSDDSAQTNALDQLGGASGCLPANGQSQPTFYFTVVSGSDTTPPTVVSIVPTNGSTGVSLAANIVVTFSEPMNPLSLNDNDIGLLIDQNGNRLPITRSFDPAVTVVTLNPGALLASLTTYRVTVAAGGPLDLAGNVLANGAQSTFTTLDASTDTTRPQVSSTCPAAGATNVERHLILTCNAAYSGFVVVHFSEAVNPDTLNTGTVRLMDSPANPNDDTQAVTLQPDGTTVTITPIMSGGSQLKNNTRYQIRLSASITDLVGNPLIIVDQCGLGTGEYCIYFDT